jgi:formate hydrogenlyase subunit 4
MKLWTILVASTFIPVFFVGRWTMSMKRGGGPQGGEALFLFWLMLMMWIGWVSMSTASAYIAPLKAGPLRSFMLHVGVFVALVMFMCKIGAILNDASLSDISDAQARNGNLLGIGLFAALIVGNLILLMRRG